MWRIGKALSSPVAPNCPRNVTYPVTLFSIFFRLFHQGYIKSNSKQLLLSKKGFEAHFHEKLRVYRLCPIKQLTDPLPSLEKRPLFSAHHISRSIIKRKFQNAPINLKIFLGMFWNISNRLVKIISKNYFLDWIFFESFRIFFFDFFLRNKKCLEFNSKSIFSNQLFSSID